MSFHFSYYSQAKLETKALKAKRPGFTDERYNETAYYVENGERLFAQECERASGRLKDAYIGLKEHFLTAKQGSKRDEDLVVVGGVVIAIGVSVRDIAHGIDRKDSS